jgi:hypothetical protein
MSDKDRSQERELFEGYDIHEIGERRELFSAAAPRLGTPGSDSSEDPLDHLYESSHPSDSDN